MRLMVQHARRGLRCWLELRIGRLFCLLVAYRPLARVFMGHFCRQSSSCTHGGIELKAYEYFARVVLLLWVDLHERKPGQRLLKPLCCSTQPKTSLCAAH